MVVSYQSGRFCGFDPHCTVLYSTEAAVPTRTDRKKERKKKKKKNSEKRGNLEPVANRPFFHFSVPVGFAVSVSYRSNPQEQA